MGPAVDADPDAQRRRELVAEGAGSAPATRATMAAAATSAWRQPRRRPFHAEQRHHAVAGELVDDAAGVGDRAAHRLEVAIEKKTTS